MKVHHFQIVMEAYHNTPVGRLRFKNLKGEIEESLLYTPKELNNLILLWKNSELLGSFGIGTTLDQNATFEIMEN